MVTFLQRRRPDPSQRGHENKLCDHKAMSDEELKALEAYVYSHVK
jgi:hypothetical protein